MPLKLRIALAVSLCAGLLTGCSQTLHPLYTEDVAIFREELLGTWSILYHDNAGINMRLESIDDKAYRIEVSGEGIDDMTYLAHLVELGGHMYLDAQLEFDENDPVQLNVLPLHQIVRIRFEGEGLVTDFHDPPWIKDYLRQHPDELEHTFIGNGERLVITADTEELQQFYIEHGGEEVATTFFWRRIDEDH